MSIFDKIKNQYQEIDGYYAKKEFTCRSRNYHNKEEEYRKKRELNDHAFFLFLFTRLEDIIREKSSELISKKQTALTNWKRNRVWGILPRDKESKEINFKNRLALLVDKNTHNYRDIMRYYDLRNKIAHGGNFTVPVAIPTVINDMKRFLSILKS